MATFYHVLINIYSVNNVEKLSKTINDILKIRLFLDSLQCSESTVVPSIPKH